MKQIINGIYLPERDKHFAEQIRNNPLVGDKGTYQIDKLCASINECNNLRFAIDVGANVGLWSRLLALKFEEVAAIEPVPENLECLRLNTGELDNVRVYPLGISRIAGKLNLKYTEDVATASVCEYEERDIEIACKPLDSFRFSNVDFIKIDVEGFEKNVVESGEMLIKRCKPVITVEQKKRTVKYDGCKLAAITLLKSWGMDIAWENHGDYCMVWP